MRSKITLLFVPILLLLTGFSHAATGAEGAAFLDIPVGAEPAALGGAYSTQATNAYAPSWNPGGLGRIESAQLAAQHLSYLESINYESMSLAYPFQSGRALGFAVQYLGSGSVAGTDAAGNSIGNFSGHYAAYELAYGQSVTDRLSLGVTGKIIDAAISNVSASAYALDFGSLYKVNKKITLAGIVANVGSKLTFLSQRDSLPLSFRLGASYETDSHLTALLEWVYEQTGLVVGRTGLEWKPCDAVALRVGYRTDTINGLSPLAGVTTGIGLQVLGQEFSYAWVPMGDLGNTQYFSVLIRFGGSPSRRAPRRAIQVGSTTH
jgi:hypothetical protein